MSQIYTNVAVPDVQQPSADSITITAGAGAESPFDLEFPTRPTPEQVDKLAKLYLVLIDARAKTQAVIAGVEAQILTNVQNWGTVPPHAEKSRRLAGKLSEITVTKADTLIINDERVVTLKEALEANGHGEYFNKLFTLRSKYEVVEGAEAALKSESLPKRLSEKVLNLWGRCISVKDRKSVV